MKHNTTTGLSDCTILYTTTDGKKVNIDKDAFGVKIVAHSYNKIGIIKFEKPIIKIPAYAFSQCTTLLTVTIPESVKTFYTSSFYNCTNIQQYHHSYASDDKRCIIAKGVLKLFASGNISEYTIPNNIIKIGKGVFRYSKLKKVIIPESVHTIDDCAFQYCKSLSEVIIFNGVTELGQSAFSNCTKLKSITIPNSITKVGDWAFVGCKSLIEFNSPLATADKRCLVINGELVAFASAGIIDYVFPSEIVSYKRTVFDYNSKLKGVKKVLDQRIYNATLITAEKKRNNDFNEKIMVIAITQAGYIKKTPKNEFLSQKIGTKGVYKNYYSEGVKILKEASLWDTLLLFTQQGLCYKIEVADIPSTNEQAQGISLFEKYSITNDTFCDILPTRNLFNSDKIEKYSVLIMKKEGLVVRNRLSDYKTIKNGQRVTCIDSRTNTDYVVSVSLAKDNDYVFNCSAHGYGKSFNLNEIRLSKLSSKNIGDYCHSIKRQVQSLVCIDTIGVSGSGYSYDSTGRLKRDYNNLSGSSYLLVSNKGFFIRTFTCLDRKWGDGMMLMKLNDSDSVISNFFVLDTNEVLVVTSKGETIRIDIEQVKLEKTGKKGIQCIELSEDDKIVACCKMSPTESISITVDNEKVREYMEQTQESQKILSNIFNEEADEKKIVNTDNNNIVKEMLSLLFTKEQWDKDELETICKSKGLMLGSILEEINDYSYSVVDDVVLEDEGDAISVIMDYKEDLL